MWQVYFILSFKIFNTLHRRICLIKENHILDFPQVQNKKKKTVTIPMLGITRSHLLNITLDLPIKRPPSPNENVS